ncbi:MAG TPA: helix-turn-helix domain-containing protein [Candidatus Limnocylindrales bacterium]|nr:helix-turn-helix domain-containing protein [Candidatus Limnocylindrales bacterium]
MDDVNLRPPSLRAERAAATRTRILEAARARFSRDGYAASTLTDVAADAGVAVQTVYAVFGSKPGILRGLRELVARDPVADDAFEAAVAGRGAERLHRFAHSIRLRWERGWDVTAIHRDAALSDASIRAEVEAVLARRGAGIGRLVADGTLGPPARAQAIVDALTLPEVYERLVRIHGWSADEYEAWLARALVRELGGRGQASAARG